MLRTLQKTSREMSKITGKVTSIYYGKAKRFGKVLLAKRPSFKNTRIPDELKPVSFPARVTVTGFFSFFM